MTRSDIGQALALRLYAAESAIDAALIQTARLAAYLPEARAEAYLSAVTGQKAFEDTAQTVLALSEARGHLVRTHGRLAALARSLGLGLVAEGIESEEQRRFLHDMGVTVGQGFLFAPGLAPDEFARRLPLRR